MSEKTRIITFLAVAFFLFTPNYPLWAQTITVSPSPIPAGSNFTVSVSAPAVFPGTTEPVFRMVSSVKYFYTSETKTCSTYNDGVTNCSVGFTAGDQGSAGQVCTTGELWRSPWIPAGTYPQYLAFGPECVFFTPTQAVAPLAKVACSPTSTTVAPGSSVTWKVFSEGGTAPYVYKWKDKNGAVIPGAILDTYSKTYSDSNVGQTDSVTVVITSGNTSLESPACKVSVKLPPIVKPVCIVDTGGIGPYASRANNWTVNWKVYNPDSVLHYFWSSDDARLNGKSGSSVAIQYNDTETGVRRATVTAVRTISGQDEYSPESFSCPISLIPKAKLPDLTANPPVTFGTTYKSTFSYGTPIKMRGAVNNNSVNATAATPIGTFSNSYQVTQTDPAVTTPVWTPPSLDSASFDIKLLNQTPLMAGEVDRSLAKYVWGEQKALEPGAYWLRTCADVWNEVTEADGGNNCSTATKVTVENNSNECIAKLPIKNGQCKEYPNEGGGGFSGWDCQAYYTDGTEAIPFTENFDLAFQPFLDRVCGEANWSRKTDTSPGYGAITDYFTCTNPRLLDPPVNICRTIPPRPSCSGKPQPVKAGETVGWEATASEGTAPYTFTWSGGNANVSGEGSQKSQTYSAGTYNTFVNVSDSAGHIGGPAECMVTVDPQTPVGFPKVTISATSNPLGSSLYPTVDYNTASSLTWAETTGLATACNGTGFTAKGTTGESGITTGNLTSPQTYKITCSNTSGSSSASVAVGVRPQKPTPIVTTGGNCSGEFDISWTADPLAISYTLMVDGYPVAPRITSPYRYSGSSNVVHTFQIIASNYFGSAASVVKNATNSCTSVLSAPTVLTSTPSCTAGQGKIKIWMSSAQSGATGYRLYRASTLDFPVNNTFLVKDFTPGTSPPTSSGTAFPDENLFPGGKYFYKWVAYNSSTQSPASTAVSASASLKCPDLVVTSVVPPTSVGLPFGTVFSGSGPYTISAVIKNQGEATDPTEPFKNRVWTNNIVLPNRLNNFVQDDQPITGGLFSNATRFITSGPWTVPYVPTATNVPVKVCADQPLPGEIDEAPPTGIPPTGPNPAEENNCLELPVRVIPQITATLECAGQKTSDYSPNYCVIDYKDTVNLRWTVTGSPTRCDASYQTDWSGNKTTSSFQPPNNPLLLSNLLDKFVYKYRLECTR